MAMITVLLLLSSEIRSSVNRLAEGSSPAVGSSQISRGGSDTTAVAVAAAINADECRIYTDVDGIYTTDPRVVPDARRLKSITAEEMLELSSLGAKVLQTRSIEFANKYRVPLRVLSSFNAGEGTLISYDDQEVSMEAPLISGIAFQRDEAKLTIRGIPDHPGYYQLLSLKSRFTLILNVFPVLFPAKSYTWKSITLIPSL